MKNIVLIFSFGILLFACDKDDVEAPQDNSYYLEKTTPQFMAALDDDALVWEFGLDTYQMGNAFYFINGDTSAHLEFRLMQENNGGNYFMLRTPLYDTSSDIEFNRVFGLGPKTVGNTEDDFFIRVKRGNDDFLICNSNVNYQMEIIKTEEVPNTGAFHTALKVWIKVEDLNLEECNPDYDKALTSGFILAKFYGYRSE